MKSIMAGWRFSCFVWLSVTLLTVYVANCDDHGSHHNNHHGPGGHHGPPPGGPGYHEPPEEEDSRDCREPYDENENADKGPRITYIMAVVLGCLAVLGIVAAIAVCRLKKRKLHNKIRSDPRTTPVISVVDYKLPPSDPSNKKNTPLPPYEPNRPSNKTGPTLPPVEGIAPPAYDYVPPWSPPPPYSFKEAGLNDK